CCEEAISCCDALTSEVDTIATQIDGIISDIDILDSCCDVQASQINTITTQIDILDSCCDVQASQIDTIVTQIDILDSCCDVLTSQIDVDTSQIDILISCCDVQSSQIDVLETCCEEALSCCDAQDTRIEVLESCCEEFQDLECCLRGLIEDCCRADFIDQVDSDLGKPVSAFDWSFDEQFVVVGLGKCTTSTDLRFAIYSFDGTTLTFVCDGVVPEGDANTNRQITSVRWHPSRNVFALSVTENAGSPEVFIYDPFAGGGCGPAV
ncbi:unnamed protein product, partial [marine sediment metagenome]